MSSRDLSVSWQHSSALGHTLRENQQEQEEEGDGDGEGGSSGGRSGE